MSFLLHLLAVLALVAGPLALVGAPPADASGAGPPSTAGQGNGKADANDKDKTKDQAKKPESDKDSSTDDSSSDSDSTTASTTPGTSASTSSDPTGDPGATCKEYSFTYEDTHTDTGTYCGSGMDVTRANTPGLHVETLHVSCSDTFPNGVSDGTSDIGTHVITDWSIIRYKADGSVLKTCGPAADGSTGGDDGTGGDSDPVCREESMSTGDIATALFGAGATLNQTSATVNLPDRFCSVQVSLTSYKVPGNSSEPLSELTMFDSDTVVLSLTPDNPTAKLSVNVPNCNWYSALYAGSELKTPPHGDTGAALIAWSEDLKAEGCTGGDGTGGTNGTNGAGNSTDASTDTDSTNGGVTTTNDGDRVLGTAVECAGDMTVRVVEIGTDTLVPGSIVSVDGEQLTLEDGTQTFTDVECGDVPTTIDRVPPGFGLELPLSQVATVTDQGSVTVTYEVSTVLGVAIAGDEVNGSTGEPVDDEPATAPDSDDRQLPVSGSPAGLLLGLAAAAAVLGTGLLRSPLARREHADTTG